MSKSGIIGMASVTKCFQLCHLPWFRTFAHILNVLFFEDFSLRTSQRIKIRNQRRFPPGGF